MLSNKSIRLLILAAVLIATPVLAQNKLTLSSNNSPNTVVITGRTGGNFSLSSLATISTIPNSKGEKKPCIGYAAPTPDHIVELKDSLPQLKLQVEAKGSDTTILIRGPQANNIRCEFGTTTNPNALFEGSNWNKGLYEVWVGTIDQGKRADYSLSIIGGITQP
jgi:hypothetical protein